MAGGFTVEGVGDGEVSRGDGEVEYHLEGRDRSDEEVKCRGRFAAMRSIDFGMCCQQAWLEDFLHASKVRKGSPQKAP